VIQFYLGQIPSAAVLAAATTPDSQCEARFYLGQWQFVQGNSADALKAMREAVEACPKSFTEYQAAIAELKRQGG
jgi:lipoprotein NlpI